MKFVDSSFVVLPQRSGLDGLYKHVEQVARVSYKSEDKITEDSARRMVDALIKNQHLACLEHGTVYLHRKPDSLDQKDFMNFINKYSKDKFSECRTVSKGTQNFVEISDCYVTTNARVIIENDWQDDLQYMCDPTEFHEKRYTVKFILSAGIGREFTRHRAFSFMQESSRFCNYSKGKFNSELTYVVPKWIYDVQAEKASYRDYVTGEPKDWLMNLHGDDLINQLSYEDDSVATYVDLLGRIERDYMYLTTTDKGYQLKAQEARGILPLDVKSELVMTGFASDWIHFFNLRSYIAMTGKPHPDAEVLANNLLTVFLDKGYIKYEQLYRKDKVEASKSEKTS